MWFVDVSKKVFLFSLNLKIYNCQLVITIEEKIFIIISEFKFEQIKTDFNA